MKKEVEDEFGQKLRSMRLMVWANAYGLEAESWIPRGDIPNDWGDVVKLRYVLLEAYAGEGGKRFGQGMGA